MFTQRDIVCMLVLPGTIALALSILGCFIKSRGWIAPVAMGLAFFVAFPFILSGHWQTPRFPPDPSMGTKGWLPWIALLSIAAGVFDSVPGLARVSRGVFFTAVSANAVYMILKFKLVPPWTAGQGLAVIGGFVVLAICWWIAIDDTAGQFPHVTPIVVWLAASLTAVVLMLLATLEYGQFFITLAAASFALLPAILWKRDPKQVRGLAATFAVLTASLLAGAYFTSELGTTQLLILASTPVFLWLGRWMPLRFRPWQRIAVRIVVMLIPLVTSLSLATVRFHHEQQQQQDEEAL